MEKRLVEICSSVKHSSLSHKSNHERRKNRNLITGGPKRKCLLITMFLILSTAAALPSIKAGIELDDLTPRITLSGLKLLGPSTLKIELMNQTLERAVDSNTTEATLEFVILNGTRIEPKARIEIPDTLTIVIEPTLKGASIIKTEYNSEKIDVSNLQVELQLPVSEISLLFSGTSAKGTLENLTSKVNILGDMIESKAESIATGVYVETIEPVYLYSQPLTYSVEVFSGKSTVSKVNGTIVNNGSGIKLSRSLVSGSLNEINLQIIHRRIYSTFTFQKPIQTANATGTVLSIEEIYENAGVRVYNETETSLTVKAVDKSTGEGIKVFWASLNGTKQMTVNGSLLLSIKPGTYNIMVSSEGYVSENLTVQVGYLPTEASVKLTQLPGWGDKVDYALTFLASKILSMWPFTILIGAALLIAGFTWRRGALLILGVVVFGLLAFGALMGGV